MVGPEYFMRGEGRRRGMEVGKGRRGVGRGGGGWRWGRGGGGGDVVEVVEGGERGIVLENDMVTFWLVDR